MHKPDTKVEAQLIDATVIEQLARALQSLKYGIVELTVHEGRVVQIERRERIRLDASGNRPR